jgi:hypothetical protein
MHDQSITLRTTLVAFLLAFAGNAFALHQASAKPDTAAADQAFAKLADEFFDGFYFPANPTIATQTGLHAYDSKLEDYTRAGIDRQVKSLQDFDKHVSAVDPKTLDEMTRGDRDLVLNYIHSTLLTLQTIRPCEKNPDSYSGGITNSAFAIMERKFAPLPDRLHALVEREKAMPAALLAARENLKNPPKIYTEIALEQLPGLIGFFQHDVPSVFSEVSDAGLKKQFAESNGAVIKALEEYQAWLKTSVLPNSRGDFRLGTDTYRKKLQYEKHAQESGRLCAHRQGNRSAENTAASPGGTGCRPSGCGKTAGCLSRHVRWADKVHQGKPHHHDSFRRATDPGGNSAIHARDHICVDGYARAV